MLIPLENRWGLLSVLEQEHGAREALTRLHASGDLKFTATPAAEQLDLFVIPRLFTSLKVSSSQRSFSDKLGAVIGFIKPLLIWSVIQKVAEELTDRIERTVFLDALIVEDGHCVFDELPADYVALFNELAGASSDNTMLIPWEIWRDNFIQDASENLARSFWKQLSPEPNQVNLDKLCLKRFYSLTIPRSFIYCRQDIFTPECRLALEYSN